MNIQRNLTKYLRYNAPLLLMVALFLLCQGIIAGEAPPRKKPSREKPKPQPQVQKPQENGTEANTSATSNADAETADYLKVLSSIEQQQFEEKEMLVYCCKNIRGQTLKRVLENFVTSRGSVAQSEEADMVVMIDAKSNLAVLQKIAEQVDQPVPQILVEAQVVELTVDDDFEKEMSLAYERLPENADTLVRNITAAISSPSPTALAEQGLSATLSPYYKTWGDGVNSRSLQLVLRYLQSRDRAKILSSPNLILRRGSEGSIITGEEQPILTQTVVSGSISTSTVFKSVGIKLKVTPVMITGDTVRLQVSPEVSTVSGYATAGDTGISNPIIAVRNANTELEVKDGEMLSIGGLYRTEDREIKRKVPVLGSLPVLGHFFRGTWTQSLRTQLVIFLRISILEQGVTDGVRVHKPDDIHEAVQKEVARQEKVMGNPPASIHEDVKRFLNEGK